MNMRVNQDGKFFDRFVASSIPAAIGLAIAGVVWWADSRANDGKAAEAISRIERRIDAVEAEAREARQSAANERQKTAELAGDVRNVLRSTARIEQLLDRILVVTPSVRQP